MPARALTLPDHPEGRVSDYAHVLSPEGRARLDAQLAGYAQGTTRQIAIAIFPSLDGEPIEDASMRLAEKWKIGGKKDSDGVLVTLWIQDHMVRIEVGYGLESKLTDAVSSRIIREVMAPPMHGGDYQSGLSAGVAAIDTVISGRVHPEGSPPPAPPPPPKETKSRAGSILTFVFWFVVIFFVILSLIRPRGGGSNPPPPGKGGGFGGFGAGLGAGWFLGGGGGWSSGSWGSGGGGGFSGGGGSFGGGGASGSW